MVNLLHLVVSLAEDTDVRRAFRCDPEHSLHGLADLTGEDVAAVADVARVQVDPAIAGRLTSSLDLRARDGESDRDVAIRALLGICEAIERP